MTGRRSVAERPAYLGRGNRFRAVKAIVDHDVASHIVIDDEPDVLSGSQVVAKPRVDADLVRHVVELCQRHEGHLRVERASDPDRCRSQTLWLSTGNSLEYE